MTGTMKIREYLTRQPMQHSDQQTGNLTQPSKENCEMALDDHFKGNSHWQTSLLSKSIEVYFAQAYR